MLELLEENAISQPERHVTEGRKFTVIFANFSAFTLILIGSSTIAPYDLTLALMAMVEPNLLYADCRFKKGPQGSRLVLRPECPWKDPETVPPHLIR